PRHGRNVPEASGERSGGDAGHPALRIPAREDAEISAASYARAADREGRLPADAEAGGGASPAAVGRFVPRLLSHMRHVIELRCGDTGGADRHASHGTT